MTRTFPLFILLATLAAFDTGALFGNQEPAEEVITLEPDTSVPLDCPEGVDLPDCPA